MGSRRPGYSQEFDRHQTGLRLAARFGLEHVVDLLITERQDQAAKDSQRRTPLWLATEISHAEVMRALSRVDRITFTLMLNKKEDSLAYSLLQVAGRTVRDSRLRTALHIGVIREDLDLIRNALKYEVEINARDAEGFSAIQTALQEANTSAINLLLENSTIMEGIDARH